MKMMNKVGALLLSAVLCIVKQEIFPKGNCFIKSLISYNAPSVNF